MPQHVLDGTQIARVPICERGAGVAQSVIRNVRSLDVDGAQVAVDDMAHATAAEAMAAGEVAVGDDQGFAELFGQNRAVGVASSVGTYQSLEGRFGVAVAPSGDAELRDGAPPPPRDGRIRAQRLSTLWRRFRPPTATFV